jgi:peptidoglycan/LPS O-acetylase OafA/YrhL
MAHIRFNATPTQFVKSGQRLIALDALRGIASLSVMWFHFYVFSNIGQILQPHFPKIFDILFRHCALGVVVFFVLSGFVISLSLIDKESSFSVFKNFTIRRSIRLDIPYFFVLIFATCILIIHGEAPTIGQFISHIFYLQNILGYKNIVSQFWTLCYEIQFYLFFALCFTLYRKKYLKSFSYLIFVFPFIVSLGFVFFDHSSHGWFIDRWYEFALGACTLWFLFGNISWMLWVPIMISSLSLGIMCHDITLITAACTAMAIGGAGMVGGLIRWSGGPVLMWLGKISYSLYLIHFIGDVITKKMVTPHSSLTMAITAFLIASSMSIIGAAILFYVIERPSHRLSQHLGALPRDKHIIPQSAQLAGKAPASVLLPTPP